MDEGELLNNQIIQATTRQLILPNFFAQPKKKEFRQP